MITAEQADAAKENVRGKNIEGRTLSIKKAPILSLLVSPTMASRISTTNQARRDRPRTPTSGKSLGPLNRGPT